MTPTVSAITVKTETTKSLIPETVPLQIDSIPLQDVSQFRPKYERNASRYSFIISQKTSKASTIPFQMPSKNVSTPSHICSQLPVNKPIKALRSPLIASKAVVRIVDMSLKAAFIRGASASHNSFQAVLTSSVKLPNSNPKPFSRTRIVSSICLNEATTWDQMVLTAFRNSSLVFHNVTNPATRAAAAVITRPMGPVRAENVLANAPPAPTPSSACLIYVRIEVPILAMDVMTLPILFVRVPSMTKSGPMAATNAPTLRIVFLVPSSMRWSFSIHSCNFETALRIMGIRASPIWIPSSCNADLKIEICPGRLSCIISAIFCEDPLQLSTARVSFLTSSSVAFMIARNPDIAVFPTSDSAVWAFSESVSLAKESRQSIRTS